MVVGVKGWEMDYQAQFNKTCGHKFRRCPFGSKSERQNLNAEITFYFKAPIYILTFKLNYCLNCFLDQIWLEVQIMEQKISRSFFHPTSQLCISHLPSPSLIPSLYPMSLTVIKLHAKSCDVNKQGWLNW